MAIRFRDNLSYIGRLTATLSGVTAAMLGTHVAPASRTGVVAAGLEGVSAAFQGAFFPSVSRTGAINVSLQGATAAFAGTVVNNTPGEPAVFPLEISTSGRYLEDHQGNPWLINGDTAWSIFVQLTDAEIDTYLDDRVARGFNTILVNLIEKGFADNPPNMAGFSNTAPFTTPNDIRTPNDAYFNRCVGIVDDMLSRDLLVLMTPAYVGFQLGGQGWWTTLAARTVGECQTYGEYLGTKFAALPNIVWVMGGDGYEASVVTRTNAIVTGLKATGRADWLFTYHAAPNQSSADVVDAQTWLDLNAVYDQDGGDEPGQLEAAYNESNVRPMFFFEGRYEQENSVGRAALRNQAWWSVLTGGCGAIFGNNPIWHFEAPNPIFSYSGTWQSNLASTGAQDRTAFAAIMSAYDWQSLNPDTTDTFLTAGQGSGSSTAYAAFNSAGTLAMVYTPTQKALTIDKTHFAGTMNAKWVNPTTQAETAIGTVTNSGSQDFTPPSSGDWLLVFEYAGILAASASLADVQSAVDSASNGDTVLIPNGSATWTSGLNLGGKRIWLRAQNYTPTPGGNTTRNVVLTNNVSSGAMITLNSGSDYHARVSGIRFNEGTGSANAILCTGSGSKIPMIDDCYFENKSRFGTSYLIAILSLQSVGSLTFNCRFVGTFDVNSVGGTCIFVGRSARTWPTASTMGALDVDGNVNNYMEDCTLFNAGLAPDCDNWGRFVCRYSTYDGTWGTTHGCTSDGVGGGGRHVEYYNNTFTVSTTNRNLAGRYFWMRAGSGVFTDNSVSASNVGYNNNAQLTTDYECGTPSYPALRQVGQGHNGTSYVLDPVYVWNQTGNAAYTASGSGSLIQVGRDIIVNSGAKPGYTKFTYPHPVRSSL